jgi:ATP synthase F1 delta subunit
MNVYVKALLLIAKTSEQQEKWRVFLSNIADQMVKNKKFKQILFHPRLSLNEKLNFLVSCFNATKPEESFLRVLLKADQIKNIFQILRGFISEYQRAQPVLTGTITSSIGIDKKILKKLEELFSQKLGKTVSLLPQENLNILGVIAQVGSYQYEITLDQVVKKLSKELQRG